MTSRTCFVGVTLSLTFLFLPSLFSDSVKRDAEEDEGDSGLPSKRSQPTSGKGSDGSSSSATTHRAYVTINLYHFRFTHVHAGSFYFASTEANAGRIVLFS